MKADKYVEDIPGYILVSNFQSFNWKAKEEFTEESCIASIRECINIPKESLICLRNINDHAFSVYAEKQFETRVRAWIAGILEQIQLLREARRREGLL